MQIVLVEPQIPPNTGNIARLCAATNTTLYLVGKLGFSLDDRYMRRAGLDYWEHVKYFYFESFEIFENEFNACKPVFLFFSTKATKLYYDAPYSKSSFLIFGSETNGLSDDIRERYHSYLYKIPITKNVRSLNLSTAVGIAAYEGFRQIGKFR